MHISKTSYAGIDTVNVAVQVTHLTMLKDEVMPLRKGWRLSMGNYIRKYGSIRAVIPTSQPWTPATCYFGQEVSRYNETLGNAGQVDQNALRAFRKGVEGAIFQSKCSCPKNIKDALLGRADVYFDVLNVPTLTELRDFTACGRREKYLRIFLKELKTYFDFYPQSKLTEACWTDCNGIIHQECMLPACLRGETAFRAALLCGDLTVYIKHISRRYEELRIYRKIAAGYADRVLIRHEVCYRHQTSLRDAFRLGQKDAVRFSFITNPFRRRRLMTSALDFITPLYGPRLHRRALDRLIFASCFGQHPYAPNRPYRCFDCNHVHLLDSAADFPARERGPPSPESPHNQPNTTHIAWLWTSSRLLSHADGAILHSHGLLKPYS